MQIRRACDGLIKYGLKKEYYLDGVDVHLFFSLCGGTGSGIFYDVAKLVKQIIPSSNIIYYVFSNAYFPDFVRMKLFEANTCASLFELNNLPFLHNRLIYIDKQYSGKDVIIYNNYYSLNYVVKQSIEEIFGYSLFINCPSDKRILDFKSFDTNVNNEHCSPFSTSVFEDLYNNMMYNGMA